MAPTLSYQDNLLFDLTFINCANGLNDPACLVTSFLVIATHHKFGIPIYDTVSTAVWKSLKVAGVDPRAVTGWGRLFQEVA